METNYENFTLVHWENFSEKYNYSAWSGLWIFIGIIKIEDII